MSDWGPKYWIFLHSLVEKIGCRQNLKKLQEDDETRYVIQIFNAVLLTMPCIICRKHYKEWLIKHSLKNFSKIRGIALRILMRKWLWDLHVDVNISKKVDNQIGLDEIEGIYSIINVQDALQNIPILTPEMKELRRIAKLLFSLWLN
jgi:hypothetical protein